jgi:SAM-dependent methyltransferase
MQHTDWWKDFFSGLAVDMWQRAVPAEQTAAEAEFIQKHLGTDSPASLLDVPCGSGRLAVELASRGFTLSAVDLSSDFLRAARTGAHDRKVDVSWFQRDMRDLPWPGKFDGVICFGNSFGYFDDEGNGRFLDAVLGVLKSGGRFLLDASSVAENVIPQIRDHTEMQIGDIRFIEDNHYDCELGRLDTDYTFVKGGRTERKSGSHRLYTYREIHSLLTGTGFKDIETFGSIAGDPFKLGAPGLYVVAQR